VISVETGRFEVTTPGPDFINPRCFGEDFALWLREQLAGEGIGTSEPIQEDWGWVLLLSSKGHAFTLAIGVMDESIGQVPAVWRLELTYERVVNKLTSLFRAAPGAELVALFGVLVHVLKAEASFTVSEGEP
jgi:hypothetical protein